MDHHNRPVLPEDPEPEMDRSEALFVDVAGYAEARDDDFHTMDDNIMFRDNNNDRLPVH